MNKANECTCPSGDGSLVHPCPAHPAVEQACWDERKLSDLGNELHNLSCSIVHENEKLAEQIGGIARELWNWPQACAALAQPSPAGEYGDAYQGAREDIAIWKRRALEAEQALRQAHNGQTFMGEPLVQPYEAPREKVNALFKVLGFSGTASVGDILDAALERLQAQPSPAQAEQAEAERPEAVAWQYRVTAGPQTGWSLWHPGKGEEFERSYTVERRPLMTVAQHERIVGELRAVIAQLRQHKNDYMDSGQETYRALQNEIREREAEIARLDGLVSGRTAERDAALARVAELEAKLSYPTAVHQWQFSNAWFDGSEEAVLKAGKEGSPIRTLYTAPAQAQHSVPEGWVQSLPLKDHQPCKPNEDRANGYTIPIYSRPVLVEEALRKLRAVLCDPIGNVVIDGSDGDREEVQRALGMLAAAPGKEGV